jgi:iodotyrosine deiodinase
MKHTTMKQQNNNETIQQWIKYDGITVADDELIERSRTYYEMMDKRRSVRTFSNKTVPIEVIENIIKTASTAPSGAHKQPWTFCVVSDIKIKKEIRKAAEEEEYTNYNGRMSEEWLDDLKAFGTDWHKPFLETAPYLIIVFKKAYNFEANNQKTKNYYVNESVGIACGFLISAIHQTGLVTLTHTPSPMNFLQKILNRPDNERPYLLIPVGYPTENVEVPNLKRKPLEEVMVLY